MILFRRAILKTTTHPKRSRPAPRQVARSTSVKGDLARAMFARWECDHIDPRPMSWAKLGARLAKTS